MTPSSLLFVELYQNFIFLNIGAKIFYRSLNWFLQFIFCQTMGIRSYKSGGETSDLIYRLCSHFSGYLLRWHENHTDPYQTYQTGVLFTHKMILVRFLSRSEAAPRRPRKWSVTWIGFVPWSCSGISTKSFLLASLCLQLKKLWGKADPVQTKHQLFETKLLLQRGHVME